MVALESTLITHGLPAPDNLEIALGAEYDVRAGDAVPATQSRLRPIPTTKLPGTCSAAITEWRSPEERRAAWWRAGTHPTP